MTLDDFSKLPKSKVIHLYYNCVNEGDFRWKHSHVDADRVFGQFAYDDDEWSEVGDFLYEFDGLVCRGSGAEPVYRSKQEADDRRGYDADD